MQWKKCFSKYMLTWSDLSELWKLTSEFFDNKNFTVIQISIQASFIYIHEPMQ